MKHSETTWRRRDLAGTSWLSTRKLSLTAKQAERLQALNIRLDWQDFITIDYSLSKAARQGLAQMTTEASPCLLVSSQNAILALVKYFSQNWSGKSGASARLRFNFYCVGRHTTSLAKQHFPASRVEYLGDSAKQSLANILSLSQTLRTPVYFCAAQDPLPTLPNFLKQQTIAFLHLPLYRTQLIPIRVSSPYNGILFYSPSGVEAFFAANPEYSRPRPEEKDDNYDNYDDALSYGCIGQSTVCALHKFCPQSRVLMPKRPSRAGLIDCLLGLAEEEDFSKSLA